jgi:hypothetical protein
VAALRDPAAHPSSLALKHSPGYDNLVPFTCDKMGSLFA